MKLFVKIFGRLMMTLTEKRENILGLYNSTIVNNPSGSGFVSGKVLLRYPGHITIGKNSYVNGGQLSASPNAYIKIGDNCLISYQVHLRTDMHIYKERDILIREQGHQEADIIIENDVWIGYGAQIFGGVTLGEGCVVGAGTIVTKDVMPYQVVVGESKMRVIGERI
ncbi:MAG: acyltransferase [Lachnospiraceae bacterium]|jgi:maltose O-acetyltransferase|nr:acyltransferase [Lachnospiraceae bacterium]